MAVVKNHRHIISSVVASQDEVHARFGGVVPELASRRHIEVIAPLLDAALENASLKLKDVDGIAVTRAPGLIGSLLVGLSFAKALAYANNKPLVGVNHLEGHLNAAHLSSDNIGYPHVGLVVSGGHTSLYLVKKFGDYKLLGATRDDAAGEAYDKVAKLLGLGYPGGPVIDRLSPKGNADAIKFTTPKLDASAHFQVGEFDFSFSGIKTAVIAQYNKMSVGGKIAEQDSLDLIASFQKKVVEILCKQTIAAANEYKCKDIIISGGVAANSALRKRINELCNAEGISAHIPPISLCTDNAAMVAYVGSRRLELGQRDGMELNATATEEIGV